MKHDIAQKIIHPLIDKLDISNGAKAYFNEQKFYEIIQAPVSINTASNPINEATENWWVFTIQNKDYTPVKGDLNQIYEAIINTRAKFLKEHCPDLKMELYAWYDPQAGNFNFSLRNAKEEKLPFGCNIKMVSSLDEIWQEFIADLYKGTIPWGELKTSDLPEDSQNQISDKNTENYTLSVWAVTLP